MKKIFTAVLAALLLLSLPLLANASEAPYRYMDSDGGVQLTVPEGWDLEYEADGPMKVTFVPQEAASALMQYGYLADSETGPSLAAAAQLVGCSEGDVKRLSLNGTEYYRAVFDREVPCGAFSLTLPMTCWIHWENGIISLYAYVGSEGNPLYGQFKAMVSGAAYTQAVSETVTAEETTTAGETVPVEALPAETIPVETAPEETAAAESIPAETAAAEAAEEKTLPAETAAAEPVPEEIPAAEIPVTETALYADAVRAYEAGDYVQAQTLFSSVPELEDSGKYLRLLRIRSAGGNVALGTGSYQKDLGLTAEDKLDIDEAAKDFGFADTAQVLLCRSDVAAYYLTGHWSGGINNSYLYFKPGHSGVTCRIGSNLSPKNYPDFGMENGEFHGYEAGEEILLLKLRLTDANTLEVTACQQGNQVFTLIRK